MAVATSSSTTKPRVVKLLYGETVRFLELYANERVLYDTNMAGYKDRDLRIAAAKRISEALDIPEFGPKEVICKFKNLRSSYCQELKKIADSELTTGVGSDDDIVYRPKIFWFDQMNSFIRPFVHQRPTQSNWELQTQLSKDVQEQSESPSQYSGGFDDYNESTPRSPQIKIENETPVPMLKRKICLTAAENSKISKVYQDPQIDFMYNHTSEKLENIIIEDTYDCFGKYVASLLRSIGHPTALRLQETITSVIVNTMCPRTASETE